MATSTIQESALTTKSVTQAFGDVASGAYATITIDISSNKANYRIIKGYHVNATPYLCIVQLYCPNSSQITVRAYNMASGVERNGTITVYYI